MKPTFTSVFLLMVALTSVPDTVNALQPYYHRSVSKDAGIPFGAQDAKFSFECTHDLIGCCGGCLTCCPGLVCKPVTLPDGARTKLCVGRMGFEKCIKKGEVCLWDSDCCGFMSCIKQAIAPPLHGYCG